MGEISKEIDIKIERLERLKTQLSNFSMTEINNKINKLKAIKNAIKDIDINAL